MEHLHIKICFIDTKLYTTDDIVASSIEDLLLGLSLKSKNNIIDILCDKLPYNDIITYLKNYRVSWINTNATFIYRPVPHGMVEENEILLCKANYTDGSEKIHQIAFKKDNITYRFGVPV